MSRPPAVVIASPTAIVRDVVAAALRTGGIEVAAGVATLPELEAAARAPGVTVAVLGTDVAAVDVLDPAIRRLLTAGVRTVVLTRRPDDVDGRILLLAGASGLLTVDDSTPAEVVDAVRTVATGHAALHPDVLRTVLGQWRAMQDAAAVAPMQVEQPVASEPVQLASRAPVALSDREHDVLAAMAGGAGNRQIARQLGIAEKTVESHKARLRAKLGARNQAHAVSLALEAGLVARPEVPGV